MATQRRQAAHDSGEDIWRRVARAGEDGLSREEAIGRNTSAQFERGKAWIRDYQCKNKKTGFVLVHGRYTATNDVDKCKLYAAARLRALNRQAVRIFQCSLAVLPPEAQNDLSVMLLIKACNDVFDAMQMMDRAGFSPQAAAEEQQPVKASTSSARSRKTAAGGRRG
ncbi:hypothetical protein [Kitasatospora sp. NPDC057198]|uniref:hypothetical protein n=1 Tax=Kitasatospora sp. NPDC057198 TaxID=3346046 RepID=UPI003634219B